MDTKKVDVVTLDASQTAGALQSGSVAAAFAVSRIIEQNLLTVEPGVIEAGSGEARSTSPN